MPPMGLHGLPQLMQVLIVGLLASPLQARALSVLLGEDQDLAMLERLTEAAADKGLRRPDAQRIANACRKRRKALQKEALARADRLFLEKPRRFAAQIARAWTIAAQIKGEASKQQVGKNV